MDDELIIFLVCVVGIVLDFFISRWFYTAAKEKGHQQKKYFWICFWLGMVGWLLIIALPDRGGVLPRKQEPVRDELPEL